MGDKIYDVGDKMSNECVTHANSMASKILNNEFKGAGDTIEAAAYRSQRKLGVKATLLLRLRYRSSEMRDMKASSWFSIFDAYQKVLSRAQAKLDQEKTEYEHYPIFERLADFVAGQKTEKE